MKGEDMTLLQDALACPRCIISVIGDHAGEGVDVIFKRKIADIKKTGKTFWLVKSYKSRPAQVQEICQLPPTYTIFIKPLRQGGARATINNDAAREYYIDEKKTWFRLPAGLSPVTGKLDAGTTALVFDMLTTSVSGTIELWRYADFSDEQKTVKFRQGCSTVCAILSSHPKRMKSQCREIVAVAKFTEPYGVWLR